MKSNLCGEPFTPLDFNRTSASCYACKNIKLGTGLHDLQSCDFAALRKKQQENGASKTTQKPKVAKKTIQTKVRYFALQLCLQTIPHGLNRKNFITCIEYKRIGHEIRRPNSEQLARTTILNNICHSIELSATFFL